MMARATSGAAPIAVSFRGLVHPTGSRTVTIVENIRSLFILSLTGSELNMGALELRAYKNRKCQRMSTNACTMAEAKIEPVLRHVQP
jgi:hypothetical protein